MLDPEYPATLGKYRIDAVLGSGSMGTVYRAYDPDLGRPLAIKTLHKALLESGESEEFLARFRREAKAAAGLNHPNIVTVHDYGEERGIPYIVMELAEGSDLKELLEKDPRPSLAWTLDLMRQVLCGLTHCHAQGIVHRDIKPGNFILLPDGRVKITDFGIARVEDSDLTRFGDQLGSPAYMSPEQILGKKVDRRSDLFSVGVVLYEMLTGRKPFSGQSVTEIMHKVLRKEAQSARRLEPSLSPAADRLLRKALQKKPEDRFQTAQELADALAALAPSDDATEIRKRSGTTGRKWLLPAVLAPLLLVLAFAGWLAWKGFGSGTLPSGSVWMATRPPGAAVWLAGKKLGLTPNRFELPAGDHEILLTLDGYRDLPVSLAVEPGAEMDFELELAPGSE